MQEPEPRDSRSHRQDSPIRAAQKLPPRWTCRIRFADETPDTGFEMITPAGRVGPRLTGPPPTYSRNRREKFRGGLDEDRTWMEGRGLIVGVSALVLLLASVAAIHVARHTPHARETGPANPAAVSSQPAGPPSAPADYGTLPPDAGVPGNGSAPPTMDGSPTPAPAAAPTRPAPQTYAAAAGESCPQTADHGYFRKGFARDWRTRGNGGWTGDGCRGAVVAVPMSGDPRLDDNDNVIVWWFATAPVTLGSCTLSVYVPDTGDATDSAGQPAHYLVFSTPDATGATVGEFDVDQTRNRGKWVNAGRFPLSSRGRLSVRMVTRGIDFGPGHDGAHLGVSALRAVCAAG